MNNVIKQYTTNKAQLTWVSIIIIFVSIVVMLIFFPILDTMIESTIVKLGVGNEYTPLIVTILRLILVILPIGMIISIINQANPPKGY